MSEYSDQPPQYSLVGVRCAVIGRCKQGATVFGGFHREVINSSNI